MTTCRDFKQVLEGIAFPSVAWKLLLAKDEKDIEIESKSLETFIAIWI